MGILLAFAPFFMLVGVTAGFVSATTISAGLPVRGAVGRNKTIKVLEFGTVALFGGLAAYILIVQK
jgi:hypothetical protein